jgi:hypothetical protein
VVCLARQGKVERAIDPPHGLENRRGLCGLLRLDVVGARDRIADARAVER